LSNDDSNHLVVKEAGADMPARTEIEIDALPQDVWDALVDGERREDWLQEPDREVHIEVVEAPSRLVWWWGGEDEPATRVEFEIVAAPAGARVIVTESEPAAFPLSTLAASFAPAAAGCARARSFALVAA
jgi:uncharacterized protein YndB with AHSA1/START domain